MLRDPSENKKFAVASLLEPFKQLRKVLGFGLSCDQQIDFEKEIWF